jgi:hypothetical protein
VSAELMGIIVVIAAVIAALATAGLAPQLSGDLGAAICKIAGGDCAGTPASLDRTPSTACETLNSTGEISADVVAFSVDIGGSGQYTLSRTVDHDGKEHWYVSLQGGARAGVDVMLGEKANLGDFGEGTSAEIKAFLKGTGGAKYEFANEDAARDFVTDSEHELAKQAILPSSSDPFGLGHKLMNKIDGHSFEPPKATEYFYEGGGQLDASGEITAGAAKIGATGSGSAVVGVKISPQPDNTSNQTVYVKVSQEIGAKLGLFEKVAGDAGVKGEVVVGITYDHLGNPITATVDAAGTLKASLGPKLPVGEKTKIADIAGMTPKGQTKVGKTLGGSLTGKAQFRIDLTAGDNLPVLADGLHSIGAPLLLNEGSGNTPNPVDGVKGVYDLFDNGAEGTQLTVTTYTGSSRGDSVGVKGGDVLTFGAEGGLKFEDRNVATGSYYSPGNGFVTWEQCGK